MSGTTINQSLKEGECLTKEEFLRRCEASDEYERAELLEGVVYLNAAAINRRNHGRPQNIVSAWLDEYERWTPHVLVLSPSTMELNGEDLPEPDAMMVIDHPTFGSSSEADDGSMVGPAELVIEIAASTKRKDLHVKKRIYQQAGVKEYMVWRTTERAVDWFVLEHDRYASLAPDSADGLYKSCVFPGLWLDTQALLAMEKSRVIDRLQPGLQSPEHTAFVEKLRH